MNPDDLIYPWVDSRPLCAMIDRLTDGQMWDWGAGHFAPVPTPFDPGRFTRAMTPMAGFPGRQTVVIPAVAVEPSAVLTLGATRPGGAGPVPDHSVWLALAVVPNGLFRRVSIVGQMVATP